MRKSSLSEDIGFSHGDWWHPRNVCLQAQRSDHAGNVLEKLFPRVLRQRTAVRGPKEYVRFLCIWRSGDCLTQCIIRWTGRLARWIWDPGAPNSARHMTGSFGMSSSGVFIRRNGCIFRFWPSQAVKWTGFPEKEKKRSPNQPVEMCYFNWP
jgi:hypothetical protein